MTLPIAMDMLFTLLACVFMTSFLLEQKNSNAFLWFVSVLYGLANLVERIGR